MNETTRELDEDERGELERLRKEHEELLKDNEFLEGGRLLRGQAGISAALEVTVAETADGDDCGVVGIPQRSAAGELREASDQRF